MARNRQLKPLNPPVTETTEEVVTEPEDVTADAIVTEPDKAEEPTEKVETEEPWEKACPSCRSDQIGTLHDTGVSLYLKCGRCLHTWKHTREIVDDI